MSVRQSKEFDESLTALSTLLQQGTHGLIVDLSLHHTDDHGVLVRGTSRSYYGVQLAILATKHFINEQAVYTSTQLRLIVDGRALKLLVVRS